MKPNSVAPSTPAMEAAREIHEHEVKRRSKSAVVIHVDCEAKILAIAAILDRHFPSREPQGAQTFESLVEDERERLYKSDMHYHGSTKAMLTDGSGYFGGLIDLAEYGAGIRMEALTSRDRELREMREALEELFEALNRMLVSFGPDSDDGWCAECGLKMEEDGESTCESHYVINKAIEAVARAERVREQKEGA